MYKKFKTIFIFISLLFFVFISANFAFAETKETRDLSIQLSSALGGVVSGLPEFIERIYNYLIAMAGGLATVMIMIGGFLYLTAMGSKGQIDKAKKMINDAVIGLFLVLGAFLILNTINPATLSLKMPTIKQIERETIEFGTTATSNCTTITSRTVCESQENCVWLSMEIFSAAQAGEITGILFNWILNSFVSIEGSEVGISTGQAVGEWIYPSGVTENRGACVMPDPRIGTDGHGCRPSEPRCNENLRCLAVNSFIIGNNRELCSSGGADSPCRVSHAEEDCFGIEPASSRVCIANMCMDSNSRSPGASCTDDSQCATNNCIGYRCAFGEGTIGSECRPGPGRNYNDEACAEGVFCCTASAEDQILCGIERPTCVEKFDADHQCMEAYQCKSDYCNDHTCDCLCDYGETCASPCSSSQPTCVDEGIFDRGDHCE